jgi:hypothetical protein
VAGQLAAQRDHRVDDRTVAPNAVAVSSPVSSARIILIIMV